MMASNFPPPAPVIIFQNVETPLALRQSTQYHVILKISREWQTQSGLTPAKIVMCIWDLKCYKAPPATPCVEGFDATFCTKCRARKRGTMRTIKVIEVCRMPSAEENGAFWYYSFTIKPLCCSSKSHFHSDLNLGVNLGTELCTSPQFSLKSHAKPNKRRAKFGSPQTPCCSCGESSSRSSPSPTKSSAECSGSSVTTTGTLEGVISIIYLVTTSQFDTSEICHELSSVLQDTFPQFLTSFRVGILTPLPALGSPPPSFQCQLGGDAQRSAQPKDRSPEKGTIASCTTQQSDLSTTQSTSAVIPWALAGMMISITLTFRASSHDEAREFRGRILKQHKLYLSNQWPEGMENYTGSDLIHSKEWTFIEEKFYYYDCRTPPSTPGSSCRLRTDT
ncbi:hypothetical protein Pelo_18951 [Pelomyxa schiedti]|nr:hypothetical protein Pelo_18951 [Pelomyxa schiedti]